MMCAAEPNQKMAAALFLLVALGGCEQNLPYDPAVESARKRALAEAAAACPTYEYFSAEQRYKIDWGMRNAYFKGQLVNPLPDHLKEESDRMYKNNVFFAVENPSDEEKNCIYGLKATDGFSVMPVLPHSNKDLSGFRP